MNEVIQAVIAGYGVSFVSALLAKPYLEQGTLAKVEVENVVSKHSIWMGYRKKELQVSYIQSFIKLVMKQISINI